MKYIKIVTDIAEVIRYDLRMEWTVTSITNDHGDNIGWLAVDPNVNDRLVYRELLMTGLSKVQSEIIIEMINHLKDWYDDDNPNTDDLEVIKDTISRILRKKF